MTEIQYEVREQDLYAFNEHLLHETKPVQQVLRRHQVTLPGVLSVGALFLWFYERDVAAAVLVMIGAVAWGLLSPLLLQWHMRRQLSRMYTAEEKAGLAGRYSLRIETDHLVEISPGGESRLPWDSVLRVETTKRYAFIFVSVDSALIVPRSTVSQGNLHQFVQEADARIEAAG